jgi:hypothetical protein
MINNRLLCPENPLQYPTLTYQNKQNRVPSGTSNAAYDKPATTTMIDTNANLDMVGKQETDTCQRHLGRCRHHCQKWQWQAELLFSSLIFFKRFLVERGCEKGKCFCSLPFWLSEVKLSSDSPFE